MHSFLEFKKIKRTGLFLAFISGGGLAAAIPILRLTFQSEQNLINLEPIEKLLTDNWLLIGLLNSFLIITGACLLYSIEYSNQGLEKMKTLPIKESSLFFNKIFLLMVFSLIMLFLEMIAIVIATQQWSDFYEGFGIELMKNFGFLFLMILPTIFLALIISSLFENIWVSLGINITAIFLATMIYQKNFWLSLFPFALSFQILEETTQDVHRIVAAIVEIAVFSFIELLIIKVRRDVA